MEFKTFVLLFAQAFFIKSITAQCIGVYNVAATPCVNPAPASLATSPCSGAIPWPSNSYNAATLAASNGGGLAISSASPIAPNSVSVVSENAIEGAVAVTGALPFLGAVTLEGPLPSAGAGAVAYGCGNGEVAILSEDISGVGGAGLNYGASLGYGLGSLNGGIIAEPAYAYNGIGRIGCGCGALV